MQMVFKGDLPRSTTWWFHTFAWNHWFLFVLKNSMCLGFDTMGKIHSTIMIACSLGGHWGWLGNCKGHGPEWGNFETMVKEGWDCDVSWHQILVSIKGEGTPSQTTSLTKWLYGPFLRRGDTKPYYEPHKMAMWPIWDTSDLWVIWEQVTYWSSPRSTIQMCMTFHLCPMWRV